MLTATEFPLMDRKSVLLTQKLKKVVAFVDGYNVYRAMSDAFGRSRSEVDYWALCELICERHPDWQLDAVRYYAGIPTEEQNGVQSARWQRRIGWLKSRNVQVIVRGLKFRNGVLREKGIDTRIAIDMIRLAYEGDYNVALLFSQDQDFSEVAREIQRLRSDGRALEVACAFPVSSESSNGRGVVGARWERIQVMDMLRCQV